MSILKLLGMILFLLVSYVAIVVIFPPLNFPKNIPTIPFYVIFLPAIFPIDQTELYDIYIRESMEKYGAVKIFFGSRWNILVSRSEYLSQIFKDEDTFAKSGNQKKIPYSALAAYTGDNVISAHGKVWRDYRNAVTNGLQHFDDAPISKNAKIFCSLIKQRVQKGQFSIQMGPLSQRLALDNISQVALGFDFATLKQEKNALHEHLVRIKKQIFHPFFLTFPFLDLLPIPSRRRAFKDVSSFRELLVKKVQDQLINNYKFEQTTFAASDLIRAYNNEIIDYKQLSDNIVIILVAGHENPQLLFNTSLYLLAKYSNQWQKRLRQEVKGITDSKALAELPLLNAFIFEAVRLYPPLSTIINRCTTKACKLGADIVIPKNVYIGYNNFGSSHDPKNWGPTANDFEPDRWGSDIETIRKNWRLAKNRCTVTGFHGGRRACLGEKLALTEMRITLAEMLKQLEWSLDPEWGEKLTPAGPLCPLNLKLIFRENVQK
ncbi:dit2p [Saccharomyces arboricola H-6]|uniref:Dit2p n=1 Tax=Saccharomyces arboricola (strain H-6 / AS 2.3317 / CBS 10644) TaxID=1160507 RepID=J8PJC3_SACAR|nr:dit2p [Saccharomyces arboricola H-6]